jgi:menaquinone-dependent protoporphyrinogen oxidase
MKPILVLFATREGQTEKIARYIANRIRERGRMAHVVNAEDTRPVFALERYDAAILAASVHVGKHEREMVDFVKSRRIDLEKMETAFLSVSAAQAGVENPSASPAIHDRCAKGVAEVIDKFLADTGWKPGQVFPVAGALMYRKYNFLVRMVMRWIAKQEGGSTDTSRNTEYTDWRALDRFVNDFVVELPSSRMKTAA